MKFSYSAVAASLVTALTLSGCGGDSGSSPEGNTGKPPITGPVVGGVVITTIDGYLKNALVCSDSNANGKCEANEVITDIDGKLVLTNDKGQLDIKVEQSIEKKIKNTPIVVKVLEPFKDYSADGFTIEPGIYTVDMDQPYQAMGKNVEFRAPAGSNIATPLTDLIVAEMEKGANQTTAEANVQTMLADLKDGDTSLEIDLYADYIDTKKDTGASDAEKQLATKLHKTAQILTETQHQTDDNINLDEVTNQVVTEAVSAVNSATTDELNNPDFKPVVPVDKDETGEIVVEKPVVNYQASINKALLATVSSELTNTYMIAGENFGFFGKEPVTGLFTDKDQTDAPKVTISAESYDALMAKGIHAELTDHSNTIQLTAMESGKTTPPGSYFLELAAADLDEAGNAVGTVTTLLKFEIHAQGTAPTVNQERLTALQGEFDKLTLQQGQDVNYIVLDISNIFSDEDGDALTYSFSDHATGLKYDVQYPEVTITGTPLVSGNHQISLNAQDDDGNGISAAISLSIAKQPASGNELSSIIVEQDLYRFNANWVGQGAAKPDCWAMRLTADNRILASETSDGQCPSESSISTEQGTWALNGDNIVLNYKGEGIMTVSLNKDRSHDVNMPRVHISSISEKATIAKTATGTTLASKTQNEPATLYIGRLSAETYWQQPMANVMVKGMLTTADAASKVTGINQHESENLDADLFIETTCEELGFVADGGQDPYGNLSYRFGPNMAYQFHLLNDKFTNGMFTINNQTQESVAFASNHGKACAVDFDYTGNAHFKPGESIVVFANPTGETVSEEFIINTFVDRNYSIEPQASILTQEAAVYAIEINKNSGSFIKIYHDGNQIKELESTYDPQTKEWRNNQASNAKFFAYTINGKQLLQVASEFDGQPESYTLWRDAADEVKSIDAGIDAMSQPNRIFVSPTFETEGQARAAVENAYAPAVSFVGTRWTEYDSSEIQTGTITYNQNDVTYEFIEDGTNKKETFLWNEMPNDLPCLVAGEHTCNLMELNSEYQFCDTDTPTDWDNCPNKNKYLVQWHYSEGDGTLYREKTSLQWNHVSNTRMVPNK
ncbi:hypothetical protein A3K86_08195 [Photobacterium jeanii]|uniref:Dystroglycan-type cadherin-like domain-containing protein n=1 Tax=Photobacterium jeanii TaxID=858640 RepID=A0A178KI44_9GAMM|nr:hypothetical protein [Photobacterium jeanii]OAN16911.1 hypothetical protein A3K86_08195 [Photobacterium jeanii]PST88201.1 hypothetical protein C9I91_16500 [Photobacterium jeanii]